MGETNLYKNLNHPDIAEQLKPYILDKSKNEVVRRVAIDIAEECQISILQEVLANVVLDIEEDYYIRINSAWAVIRIADTSTKATLRPLVGHLSRL